MPGQSGSYIGQTAPPPDSPGRPTGRMGQDRYDFPRVVGAAEGRVVAVVGGDDQEIAGPQSAEQLRQAAVEMLKAGRVAGRVAAMTMIGIEVDEIGEGQAAIR